MTAQQFADTKNFLTEALLNPARELVLKNEGEF